MASRSTSPSATSMAAPLTFNGENYDYWCIKMKLSLKASAV